MKRSASVRYRIATAAASLALIAAPARTETSFAALKYSADRGDAWAQNELGNWHDRNDLPDEAFHWYSEAARRGFAPAQNNLGTCYERGVGVKADMAKAAMWYAQGAEGGDSFAQRNLAALLMEGNGVPQDLDAGLAWLRKSAAQENYLALYDLGVHYEIGVSETFVATNLVHIPATDSEGTYFEVPVRELRMVERVILPPDEKVALECYRRSQRKGYRPAWWKVGVFAENGRFCRPNPAYARYCYEKAGPNVSQAVAALVRMGAETAREPSVLEPEKVFGEFLRRLSVGGSGKSDARASEPTKAENADHTPPPEWPALPPAPPVPPDPEPKFKIPGTGRFGVVPPAPAKPNAAPKTSPVVSPLREASVSPAEAHNRGVAAASRPGGMAEAVRWYREAADHGFGPSCVNLGRIYYLGEGVPQDYREAVKWFRKAAEKGEKVGQHNLGVCLLNGRGIRKDAKEAVRWFRKAAEQGYSLAQHSLGACYVNGDGVRKDYNEAIKWFRKAAAQGNADSKDALRQLGVSP